MTVIARRIATLGTENAFKLGDDIRRCVDRGMDVIKFNLGEPDFDSAPHINAVGIREIEAGNSHYCDPAGLFPFRQAIAKHVSDTRGFSPDPEQIVVTAGAKPPIGYTMLTYVDPGDEVIYPSPGFPIYESWITFAGARPVPLRLSEQRGFAFTPDDLAALITDKTKVIMICSPSNPTGGVLSRDLIEGIADVIRTKCRPDVRVYADEIYEHIVFDGARHQSITQHPGMPACTVLAGGLSKGFAMTGWRLGWAVLPSVEEASVFKQLNINIISCVPPFIQEAGTEAYSSPETPSVVAKMVSEFQERRDWIVPALNAVPGVRCQRPKGAFYVFPNIEGACRNLGVFKAYASLGREAQRRTSPAGMFQMFLLYRYGVATMDRNSFGRIGAEHEHFLRISIANSLEQIQTGVSRIQEAVANRAGFDSFVRDERPWDRS